ncbi:MAG: hypothetical protein JRE81_04445 [Deltaproteobacteria bacterium]|jgi:hypothetical protein|nr:hypothetical protein [Deltaproteobacteria bacterium]
MRFIIGNSPLTFARFTICFCVLLVFGPLPTHAQHHAVGEAWIHRDAPQATRVHLPEDPLCLVEFQERCFGGMMAPDSILCELGPLAESDWPEQCPIAIECLVSDPDGHPMLDGTGMHGEMMLRDVHLTVHYSPDRIMEMGLDATSLCLAIWDGARWVIESEALHDPALATFSFSTRMPTARYAVLPRTAVQEARMTWSKLKTLY